MAFACALAVALAVLCALTEAADRLLFFVVSVLRVDFCVALPEDFFVTADVGTFRIATCVCCLELPRRACALTCRRVGCAPHDIR